MNTITKIKGDFFAIKINDIELDIMGFDPESPDFKQWLKGGLTPTSRNHFYPAGVIGSTDINFLRRESKNENIFILEVNYEYYPKKRFEFSEAQFKSFFSK